VFVPGGRRSQVQFSGAGCLLFVMRAAVIGAAIGRVMGSDEINVGCL